MKYGFATIGVFRKTMSILSKIWNWIQMKVFKTSYYARHRRERLAYQKKWSRANQDKRREYHRAYKKRNPEKIKEQKKRYYLRRMEHWNYCPEHRMVHK